MAIGVRLYNPEYLGIVLNDMFDYLQIMADSAHIYFSKCRPVIFHSFFTWQSSGYKYKGASLSRLFFLAFLTLAKPSMIRFPAPGYQSFFSKNIAFLFILNILSL